MCKSLFYCDVTWQLLSCCFEDLKTSLLHRLQKTELDHPNVTHFIFCVLGVSSPHLKRIVLRIENELFLCRLKETSTNKIKEELLDLVAYLQSYEIERSGKLRQKVFLMVQVLKTMAERAHHAFGTNHVMTDCRKYKILLPFTFPLRLVAERKTEVHSGKAVVNCGVWVELLQDVFDYTLEFKMDQLRRNKELLHLIFNGEDDRLRKLLQFCVSYLGGDDISNSALTASEIDVQSKFFPPCMANLHQILRKTHRLSYDSRYQYTLFLKDAGLSLDENIKFWESEYSVPHCGSSCNHFWDDKKGRYIYQLRHIYGQAGNNKPKSSRGCLTFIEAKSHRMDGACPFKHLPPEELKRAIPAPLQHITETILSYKAIDQPQHACAVYLAAQRRAPVNLRIHRPIQYFKLAKGQMRYF